MSLVVEERLSDSPYVESITHGWTVGNGSSIRPAEVNWHLVLVKHEGNVKSIVVGPWMNAGIASWTKDAEILWIRFKLGTFMPHLPTRKFIDSETVLPEASGQSFWLKGAAWQFPTYENVDTFLHRLTRNELLVHDAVVGAAMQDQAQEIPSRTVRHRFIQATGMTQSYIRQVKRAQLAAEMLRDGTSILDTVFEAGYFDQPHMTRALKQCIGFTPAQLVQQAAQSAEVTTP